MTPPNLAIFDVCGTLYAANTTLWFLRLLGTKHGGVAKTLDRWTSRRSPWFYIGAASQRLLGRDIARRALIGALAGMPREQLEIAGRKLTTEHLPGLAIAELHDRLSGHLAAGDETILLSNSLDVVIAPIAEALGVPFQASELEFRDGVCTGRLKSDLTGRKAQALGQFSRGGQRRLSVYTDNRSDADLLALADTKVIVLRRGATKWGEDGSEYIWL
jgi:HAD superfamily phosphoserine phosphatase-like hydrolase